MGNISLAFSPEDAAKIREKCVIKGEMAQCPRSINSLSLGREDFYRREMENISAQCIAPIQVYICLLESVRTLQMIVFLSH